MKRAVLIVLDSAGVGSLPDAERFGDAGADTMGHIISKRGLETPNMDRLGLRCIDGVSFHKKTADISGCYGKAAEQTLAKDTTSGHWEIAGHPMERPFRTYPNGFPHRVIREFEARIGRKTLGNYTASGTEIIRILGEEHMRTGKPIVYTSADSVFQIAAHEEVIPIEELYRYCQIARELLVGDDAVGRIIARPFVGAPGDFQRTSRRRDYALAPEQDTILDSIVASGQEVMAVGKIEDIFCNRGISRSDHTTNNDAGVEAILRFLQEDGQGLIFANLVDFDTLYGHRNDLDGYGKALERFDAQLPRITGAMRGEDLLMVTADHGCDPTFPGTDHTREYIPILVWGRGVRRGVNLEVRDTFADIGSTIHEYLGLGPWRCGSSFLGEILE